MDWLRRNRDPIAANLLTSLIWAGVVAVAVGVWGALSKLPTVEVFVLAIACFAAVSSVIRGWQKAPTPAAIAPTDVGTLSNEELDQRIRVWLHRRQYSIRNDPQEAAYFHFTATDHAGRVVSIARERGEPVFLTLAARLEITPEDQPLIAELPPNEEADLRLAVRQELVRQGVQFEGFPAPLRVIEIKEFIPCDGLTEAALLGSLLHVRATLQLVMDVITRRLLPVLSAAEAGQRAAKPTEPSKTSG